MFVACKAALPHLRKVKVPIWLFFFFVNFALIHAGKHHQYVISGGHYGPGQGHNILCYKGRHHRLHEGICPFLDLSLCIFPLVIMYAPLIRNRPSQWTRPPTTSALTVFLREASLRFSSVTFFFSLLLPPYLNRCAHRLVLDNSDIWTPLWKEAVDAAADPEKCYQDGLDAQLLGRMGTVSASSLYVCLFHRYVARLERTGSKRPANCACSLPPRQHSQRVRREPPYSRLLPVFS